jgi:RNA polymerase-binding transcription factor DksA
MSLDTNQFKIKLEKERSELEEQLSKIGRRNPENPQDWEPKFDDINEQESSADEMADKFEEMEQTLALQSTYENRLTAVQAALAKINTGTYGQCPECNKVIPPERLEADPAASCMCHA